MGTRGKFDFFYKGKYYMAYNHLDSYPNGIGVLLLLEIIHADLDKWTQILEKIKEVSDEGPTPEEVKKLEKYTVLSGGGSTSSWDHVLRLNQGSFYHTLHAGYLVNVNDYNVDEEYIYILDLDNKQFRAKGLRGGDDAKEYEDQDNYYNIDITVGLETEELVKLAMKWYKGDVDEIYDPEKGLARM